MSKKIEHVADHTKKTIQVQLLKSGLTFGLLVFLAFKQHEFLFHAVAAHPELNLLIIGVFAFGLVIALRSMLALFNDDKALRWMKEAYSDVSIAENKADENGMHKIMRVSRPARIFRIPKIIGQVYELIMEELMQSRSLHVSLAQRNAMMGMVNDAINREKSLVNYITGVMILMGLIGTFIGLMEMVASVGGIVGGLAKAGAGSEEAIKGVIKDLEAPLTGMATGFSASLFGLLGSLVLGLVARFGNAATLTLKHDLEHWLTRISQLEAPNAGAAAGHTSHVTGENAAVTNLAMSLVGSFRTVQGLLVRSAETMRKLADRQDTQTEAINRLISSVDAVNTRQEQALWQLRRVEEFGDTIESIRSEIILGNKALGSRLTNEFGKLNETIDRTDGEQASRFNQVLNQHRTTEAMARSLELQTARGFEELNLKASSLVTEQNEIKYAVHAGHHAVIESLKDHVKPIDTGLMSDRVGAAVDERLAAGFGAVASSLDQSLANLAQSLSHFGDAQASVMHKLDSVASQPLAEEMRKLGKSLESGLSSGFADLSRVLNVVIATQAAASRSGDNSGEIDPAILNAIAEDTMVAEGGKRAAYEPAKIAEAFRSSRINIDLGNK